MEKQITLKFDTEKLKEAFLDWMVFGDGWDSFKAHCFESDHDGKLNCPRYDINTIVFKAKPSHDDLTLKTR